MQVISDLHIHSRFSRATSKDLTIPNLEKWAKVKGLNLIGTGDFCHPEWIKEIKQLEEDQGILKTSSGFPFILSNEICLMYTEGKGRRVHLVLLAPSLDVVDQITDYLKSKGRIDYDGRPIFKIPCPEFTENLMKISKDIEIIPAHAWTSWFGIFGSATEFNSMEEAFHDQVKNIHSFETGMSSDPEMNWRLSMLDKFSILSFSDIHSFWPWRLGREATTFDINQLNYKNIINSIRENNIAFTIETPPSYGKYHFDGHRLCNFSCSPEEAKKRNNICPVCKKKLTIGVLNRVEELADRSEGFKKENAKKFYSLLPLHELLALVFGTSLSTQKVWKEYNQLINKFGNELNILLNVSKEDLAKTTTDKITNLILRNREGKIQVTPGYDGEYGKAVLETQKTLL